MPGHPEAEIAVEGEGAGAARGVLEVRPGHDGEQVPDRAPRTRLLTSIRPDPDR